MSKKSRKRLKQTFDKAQALGVEVRYDHLDCGDTKKHLYIKRSPEGWLWICHKCGESGFQANDTLETLLKKTPTLEDVEEYVNSVALPHDFSPTLPDSALTWLQRYGILDVEADFWNFGYSDSLNRLVMPIFDGNRLVAWIARSLYPPSDSIPKYITRGKVSEHSFRVNTYMDKIVIVEDMLSAIKVGRVAGSIAILGSYIPNKVIDFIKQDEKEVYIWLDMDKVNAALTYTAQFTARGIHTGVVYSRLDPKEYNELEIKKWLVTAKKEQLDR